MPKRNADEVEKQLGVELPKRYRRFLDEGEFEKLQEADVMRQTYNGPLPVKFRRENLDGFTLDDTGLLPLATIGDENQHLLFVDPKQASLPVVEMNDETGEFSTVEASLDDFLKSLHMTRGAGKTTPPAAKSKSRR